MKNFTLCLLLAVATLTLISWNEENDLKVISKVYAKYALDKTSSVIADTNLIGIWKMDADTDPHNYFVLERSDYYNYVFTYMNKEGSNRTYENIGAFFSDVNGTKFLNLSYYDWNTHEGGYFFLKVTDIDKRGFHLTAELVADTTLHSINSAAEVRERIAKNIDNPNYFKKKVHFRKILPLMYCK